MDREHIIAFIEGQLATGKITKADLAAMAGGEASAPSAAGEAALAPEKEPRDLTRVFYGIGAIIIVIGAIIMIAQNWNEIGYAGRILVTLGISFVAYVLGFVLRKPEQRAISQVMFTVSAALAPIGAFVLLSESMVRPTLSVQMGVAAGLLVVYGAAYFITKRNVLSLLAIAFATWAYYAFVLQVLDSSYYHDAGPLKFATMLLGFAYMLIGYGLKRLSHGADAQDAREKAAVQGVLNGLGALAVLGAGITVGGAFDLIFIAFVFGAFYASVYLRSRAMLALGSIFLVAHIIKLTAKHFAGSVGWPVALIGIGFIVIAVGYMTFYLNKRFIAAK